MESKDYEVISSIEMALELEKQEEYNFKVNSRIPSLDRYIDGFVGGELITVSGKTKQGKTLLLQSLTAEFAKQNTFPLWFSFEVMPKYFLRAFPELPLFYMPRRLKTNAMDWLILKCHESFKKYRTRIIIIDHLHYVIDMAQSQNMSLKIGTIIRQLKTLAVGNNYIVFLLCHTRKSLTPGEEMNYEMLRDSSLVAAESDVVIMISRNIKDPESGEAKLLIEFSRRTGVLRKIVHLIKIDGYLKEKAIIKTGE